MKSETQKMTASCLGILRAPDNALLKIPAEQMARLKRELDWTVGEKKCAAVLTKWGYSCGQSDARQLTESPAHQNEDVLVFETANSPEINTARCCFTAGYLTGFVSAKMGEPYLFVEKTCRSHNEPSCRFEGRKLINATPEFKAILPLYEEDNLTAELEDALTQLQQTKDRYQNLFEYSSVPIFIVDPDSGAFLNMNIAATELTGYSKAELLRMGVFDVCPPEFHSGIADKVKALMAKGRVDDHELSLARKDGTIRHISQTSKVLPYAGRQVIQAALHDITNLKAAEQKEKELQEQLLKSEKLSSIGRLAASVAHELKNPLGAIRNALYYIKTSLANNPLLETDPHLKEILKLAEGEVDTSVTIIGELLDFSRVVHLSLRKTQINEIVTLLPDILHIPDNVKLNLSLDENLPIAMVDPDRLRQVFINFANNGIQAMPHGGTMKISTSLEVDASAQETDEKRVIHISFEDTGVGIEPANISKIFEPLFTTKAQGTGLGLAICNNIIEKHGGKISVVSQKGKGSRFTVKIPLESRQQKEGN